MKTSTLLASASTATVGALAFPAAENPSTYSNGSSASPSWDLENFRSLVIFGDSYSDDSRLGYFINNNGSAPPVGYDNPANYNSASGGRTWSQYVTQYTSATLYNYAVSGAVCSNEITPRFFPLINGLFPSVAEYEIPAFFADSAYTFPENGSDFLTAPRAETVYAMWIGTNDLGTNAFLTDSQVAGKVVTDYTNCLFEQIGRLYDNGGRHFVLFNNAPLDLVPNYAAGDAFVGDTLVSGNATLTNLRMRELVASTNAITQLKTPVEVLIRQAFPGIRIAIFNVHDLMTDIYYNPSAYLNGTQPLNVTGYSNYCSDEGVTCASEPDPDSFLWYDGLHPSEQTERVIADAFVDVVRGESLWATYWSS